MTTPNIASLMFMVEERRQAPAADRRLAAGHHPQGARATGFLDAGHLHVDVLKVQHHGSENNVDAEFLPQGVGRSLRVLRQRLARQSGVPVIETIFNSRLGPAGVRAVSPTAQNRDFSFWFSTSSDALAERTEQHAAFVAIESLVAKLKRKSNGALSTFFNTDAGITLTVKH